MVCFSTHVCVVYYLQALFQSETAGVRANVGSIVNFQGPFLSSPFLLLCYRINANQCIPHDDRGLTLFALLHTTITSATSSQQSTDH